MRNKAIQIIETIKQNGGKAYICGGAVRDLILGVEPKDYDICTNMDISKIQELFKTKSIGLNSINVNVIGVFIGEHMFEVAQYRTEEYNSETRVPITKTAKTLSEDLLRRDFTINAMAYDPIDRVQIDLFKCSEDLCHGRIKAVNPDPVKSFTDDPLRILRAIRFVSRYDFFIEKNTANAMKETLHLLHKKVSIERINMELCKILMGNNVEKAFNVMHELGILKEIIPELDNTYGFDQKSKYHALPLNEHILQSVDISNKIIEVRLALLFHDIAKQSCITKDGSNNRYFGHARKSAEMAENIMKRLKFPTKTIVIVKALVHYHMIRFNPFGDKCIRKMVNLIGKENMYMLKDVWISDATAHGPVTEDITIALSRINTQFNKIYSFLGEGVKTIGVTDLDINGHDLITIGFRGKEIGNVLDILLYNTFIGKIANEKNDLIDIALMIMRGDENEETYSSKTDW